MYISVYGTRLYGVCPYKDIHTIVVSLLITIYGVYGISSRIRNGTCLPELVTCLPIIKDMPSVYIGHDNEDKLRGKR